MIVIGLTGNIATGKSTVARILAELGATVIDADRLAHEAMRPGAPTYEQIVARFGARILTQEGEIHRPALAGIVFSDAGALAVLESIVHPWVVQEVRRRLAACESSVAVVEAIKLLEAQLHTDCDVVWVVTAPRPLQLARLTGLRGMTLEQAERRVDAQSPQEDKVARADLVIENDGSPEELRRQVLAGWKGLGLSQRGDEEATEP